MKDMPTTKFSTVCFGFTTAYFIKQIFPKHWGTHFHKRQSKNFEFFFSASFNTVFNSAQDLFYIKLSNLIPNWFKFRIKLLCLLWVWKKRKISNLSLMCVKKEGKFQICLLCVWKIKFVCYESEKEGNFQICLLWVSKFKFVCYESENLHKRDKFVSYECEKRIKISHS